MQNEAKEHWMKLCEQAANEQDSKKLSELIDEICKVLDAKQDRLDRKKRA